MKIAAKHLLLAVGVIAPYTKSTAANAQTSPTPLPPNYITVNAPMAERLTMTIKAAHPEITKVGLHATPAPAMENAIIGSDTPSKIGKKSSPKDMKKLATGQPSVDRVKREGIYDLLLPLTDREGRDIGQGFVVMEVPFKNAASEADSLKIGMAVRDQLRSQIPDRAALYGQ